MTLNHIILIFFIVLILALTFGIVYFIPILFAKIRAMTFGLQIDFKNAKILAKDKCLQKDFLTGLKEIWEIYKFDLRKLTNHYLAGGDLQNIKNGLIEFQKYKKEPDEWFLTTFDLAKRDLIAEIAKAEKNDWKFEL